MSQLETERVRTLVEEQLLPYVGRLMAQSSTRLHLEKLGVDTPTMTHQQVAALGERLAQALRVLVGREKTEEIVRNILNALAIREVAS